MMAGVLVMMMVMTVPWSAWLVGVLRVAPVGGVIVCECTTPECEAEGRNTCNAAHYCYSEVFQDKLSRGCIDEGSPLLCENRRPKGIAHWPSLYCCNDRNLCNKDMAPTFNITAEENNNSTPDKHSDGSPAVEETRHDDADATHDTTQPHCQDAAQHPDDDSTQQHSSSSSSRIINPIYIAVPAAGVCVLLALIIFAMYLLRRRHHHFYENYHHYYHDPLPPSSHTLGRKAPPGGMGVERLEGRGGREGGELLYSPPHHHHPPHSHLHHHHHHCECLCQPVLAPCGGGGGSGGSGGGGVGVGGGGGGMDRLTRCTTDSERSSSGSETRLFLQV